jgi:hypothetical protein
MYRKYLKNERRRRLYPAAKIIGGRMNVKKISLSNFKFWAKLCYRYIGMQLKYFKKYFYLTSGLIIIAKTEITIPIIMQSPDSCM